MPDKHIWLTEQAARDLATLARRWGVSDSAAIQRAISEAVARG